MMAASWRVGPYVGDVILNIRNVAASCTRSYILSKTLDNNKVVEPVSEKRSSLGERYGVSTVSMEGWIMSVP